MKIREIFNGKFLRISSFVAIVTVLGGFGLNALRMAMDSDAATKTFSSGIGHSFYGLTIPYINSPDGAMAYCLNFDLARPQGESYNSSSSMNNPNVKGILYYGYGGGDGGALQRKHGLSDHDARLATQVTIWKYGRNNPGVIPGNASISNVIRFTSNVKINDYIEELYSKRFEGSTAPAISITKNPATHEENEHFQISDPITVTTTGTWSVAFSDNRLAQVNVTANSFQVRAPKDYRGQMTVTVTGQAGNDFTPVVWNNGIHNSQELVTSGQMTGDRANSDSTTVFFYRDQSSQAKIIKKDADGRLVQGVVFEISTNQNFNNAETLTTNAQGEASKTYTSTGTETLPTVYVREKTVPSHLVKSDETKSVQLVDGQTKTFEFVNNFKDSTLRIIKKDETGALVPQVVFEYSDNQNFTNPQELTTGANGEITGAVAMAVREKTIYVREKTVPSHLVKSTEVKQVQLRAGETGSVEFINRFVRKNAIAKIIKKDADGRLVQGVVFEISTNQNFNNAETLTTNAQGEASKTYTSTGTETLPTVYVREKTVPSHLVKSDETKSVQLVDGQTKTFEFINQFEEGRLTIKKVDENGKAVKGVVFEISETQDFARVETVTTDDRGIATKTYKTKQVAKTYYIREKSVPEHLVLSKEVKQLSLTPKGDATVTFTNEFKERDTKISKRDLSTAKPVPGATLTIYGADDKDNKNKIYENITDNSGDLPGLKLKPGKYKFIETHAPIGYKLNPNPHFFEVLEDGTILGSTVMDDERQDYEFEIDKVDQHGNRVVGAIFEAKNKIDGTILTATSDERGIAKFKGIWADYEITEKSAPNGYIKNDEIYVLQLKIDGTYERLKVVNNKVEAPNTGGLAGNILPILVSVGSILAAGTYFATRKRA